jgi:uncharacterized damage-inducible protein DinB
MDDAIRSAVIGQFGAALRMLRLAIDKCPDDLWDDRSEGPPFWQTAYHILYVCDLYMSDSPDAFTPPEFHVEHANLFAGEYPWLPEPVGPPSRAFQKTQLLEYLVRCWNKSKTTVETMTAAQAQKRCGFFWYEVTVLELLLLNLRHVQHHTGQLVAALRRRRNIGVEWVGHARKLG